MLASEPVFAQKTDIVRLANADRFTGEVKSVRKGQLQLSTDDAGTIYLDWIKVAALESVRRFDVTTSDGRRFYGSLAAGAPRTLIVRETTGDVSLPAADVTVIAPIGAGFSMKHRKVSTPMISPCRHGRWGPTPSITDIRLSAEPSGTLPIDKGRALRYD
jgi:hypothetical protein